MLLYIILFVIAASFVQGQSVEWGYGENDGPKTWGENFGGCNGMLQSPINLENSLSSPTEELFSWKDETVVPTSMYLHNNGETVILNGTWPSGKRPSIVLENNEKYVLDVIHWHWGSSGAHGSEHAVNGKRYDMEMHMVTRQPGKILVYGQLFTCQHEYGGNTPGMGEVARSLAAVKKPNSTQNIPPFSVDNLMASQRIPFFHYVGSLTTPPCTEQVKWLVAGYPRGIDENDIEEFRGLENKDGKPMVNNVRPLQSRNARPVYMDMS